MRYDRSPEIVCSDVAGHILSAYEVQRFITCSLLDSNLLYCTELELTHLSISDSRYYPIRRQAKPVSNFSQVCDYVRTRRQLHENMILFVTMGNDMFLVSGTSDDDLIAVMLMCQNS